MEQLMVLGKQRDHKNYVRTRPLHSMVQSVSSRTLDNTTARDSRTVFPGHVIQLRCDIAVQRGRQLLSNLPATFKQQSSTVTTGRLKSARLLPMGVVNNNANEEKCLGIVTARQAHSRSSTMPLIPTRNSTTIIHNNPKRRIHSAIPSSRTSMNVDDLLTISTTRIEYLNVSQHKALLHKRLHRSNNEQQETEQNDDKGQTGSTPTITNNIKVKIVLSPQTQSQEHSELPALPTANKHDSKHFNLTTNKQQSVMKKPCSNSKLSPLTGAHCKLPIGTLNGNSVSLTCKNNAIESSLPT